MADWYNCLFPHPQGILSSKPEGDSKLQELRRQAQSLCGHNLNEHKKLEIQQAITDAEDQWTRVLQAAKQSLDQAERHCTLEGQIRDYEALNEHTRVWLEEKQQCLLCLKSQTDPKKTINTAQVSLNRNLSKKWRSEVIEKETKRYLVFYFILRPSWAPSLREMPSWQSWGDKARNCVNGRTWRKTADERHSRW